MRGKLFQQLNYQPLAGIMQVVFPASGIHLCLNSTPVMHPEPSDWGASPGELCRAIPPPRHLGCVPETPALRCRFPWDCWLPAPGLGTLINVYKSLMQPAEGLFMFSDAGWQLCWAGTSTCSLLLFTFCTVVSIQAGEIQSSLYKHVATNQIGRKQWRYSI